MRRILLLLSLALAGCAPASRQASLSTDLADVQRIVAAPDSNQRVETLLAARFGGAYRFDRADAMVQETFAELVRASGASGLPTSVVILNSASYNAFSLPNGRLFITRGMLALCNDQSELAAALGHELGHVIARHAAQRVVERNRAIADTMDVARGFGDAEVTRATITAHQLSLAAFSRANELEADRISIDLLVKAGYDPSGVLRLLQSLDQMNGLNSRLIGVQRAAPNPVASHPATPERIAAAKAAIAGHGGGKGKTARDAYLAAISGMAFGEDGAAGYIRGRSYIDPHRNVAVTLPRGYVLFSAAGGLVALRPGGKTLITLTRAAPTLARDPEAALQRLMASSKTPAQIGAYEAGAAKGAIGEMRSEKAEIHMAIVTSGSESWRAMALTTENDPGLRRALDETLASLRAPGPSDEIVARPLALRIEKIQGAGAMQRYAERAGDGESGVATILALNGLAGKGSLKPGAALKVPEFGAP